MKKNNGTKTTAPGRAAPARRNDVEAFLALSDAEKEAVYQSLDRDAAELNLQPTTPEDVARWKRAVDAGKARAEARRRGRPAVGKGAERINVSVERSLLSRADAFAKRNAMTRSELIARGLELAMK